MVLALNARAQARTAVRDSAVPFRKCVKKCVKKCVEKCVKKCVKKCVRVWYTFGNTFGDTLGWPGLAKSAATSNKKGLTGKRGV